MRKSRLAWRKQRRLIELFVAGSTAIRAFKAQWQGLYGSDARCQDTTANYSGESKARQYCVYRPF